MPKSEPITLKQSAALNRAAKIKRDAEARLDHATRELNRIISDVSAAGCSNYRIAEIAGMSRSHIGNIVKAASAAKEKEV